MFDRYFEILEQWYRDHEEQVDNVLMWLLRFMILVLACAVLFLCATSCRSQQVTLNEQTRDSTTTQHHTELSDYSDNSDYSDYSEHTEHSSDTLIISFVDSGGTYNLQTGEVQGIKTIRQTRQTNTHTQTITEWQSRVESLQATSDSLAQMLKTYQIASETKTNTADIRPARSSYDRFCSCFFWCVLMGGVLAIAVWLTNKKWGWLAILKAILKI